MPLVTRDQDRPKVYVQDVIAGDHLRESFDLDLDPDGTDIYMCGNPLMIGLPEWGEDGSAKFPETTGACELLMGKGFVIDRRGRPGNVHYEEYW